MAISNGFDEAKVLAALRGRIGWKQPFDPAYAIVDAINQISASKRYYNDFHPSVTIANIKDLQEYANISNIDFNQFLSSLKDGDILNIVNTVFNEPQLVDSPVFQYERADRTTPISVSNGNNFVGYRFYVADPGYAVQLHKVRLLFDQNAQFMLYVFRENDPNPIFAHEVNSVANRINEAILPEWFLSGGRYFIGYFQQHALPAKPIEYSSNFRCYSIVGYSSVSVPNLNAEVLLGDKFQDTGYVTHGINFEMSSYRDFTNEIVQSAYLFDELQGLSMAIKVMELIYYSNRSNDTQRLANEKDLKADLERYPTKEFPMYPGFKSRYKRELEKVRKTFFKPAETITTLPTDYDLSESSNDWNRRTYPNGATDFIQQPPGDLGYR